MLLLLSGQYFSFNKVYINEYKLNFGDRSRCEYVQQAILDYQTKTNNEINKIAFYHDASVSYPFYQGLDYNGDFSVSSFYTSWSDLAAINYYTKMNYEKTVCEQKYIDYFSEKDWSELSQEQFIFEGDTLHLCVY